jgi:hypothetical protein
VGGRADIRVARERSVIEGGLGKAAVGPVQSSGRLRRFRLRRH